MLTAPRLRFTQRIGRSRHFSRKLEGLAASADVIIISSIDCEGPNKKNHRSNSCTELIQLFAVLIDTGSRKSSPTRPYRGLGIETPLKG
jgi:hypothetical protein